MSQSRTTTDKARPHSCINCAACCRNFPYIQLSQTDVEAIESFTGLAPDEFSNSGEREGEKRFLKFTENGDCIFLKMTDGSYACRIYEARSTICRAYPATDTQHHTCHKNSNRQPSPKR